MKAATLPVFQLAGIEVSQETLAMAAGKTPAFEGMTPGKPVQVFPRGEARTVDGRKVRCEAEDFQLLLGDLATRKNPVTLTVEHEFDPTWGSKAAGECASDAFIAQGDGFWGLEPRWTDDALGEIRSGARRWISPTFYATEDETGCIRPRILRDVSLVSVPNLDGMEPVTASASKTPASPAQASDRKEHEMKSETLKLLGLAAEATPEQIHEAVEKAIASVIPVDLKAQVREEMAAQRDEIRKEVREELQKESAARERKARVEQLLAKATADGKLVADNREALEKLAAADPDAFEKLLPSLAEVAPVKPWFKASAGQPTFTGADTPEGREALATQARALAAEKKVPFSAAVASLTGGAA